MGILYGGLVSNWFDREVVWRNNRLSANERVCTRKLVNLELLSLVRIYKIENSHAYAISQGVIYFVIIFREKFLASLQKKRWF